MEFGFLEVPDWAEGGEMVMVGMMLEKEPIVKGLLQTTKDRAYFLDSNATGGAPLGTLVKLGYPFPPEQK